MTGGAAVSDTSLVFNLVTRDHTGEGLSRAQERFDTAATAIGATAGAALAVGIAESFTIDEANDKLAAQLGLSEQESARVGKAAGSVYAQAYGESMEEVNTAVGSVMSSIKGMSEASSADLETATEAALNFAKTFDVEVDRAVQTAGTLINSGLAANSTQAFDLITAASQRVPASLREDVLDASDEYSQFFRTLGYSGEQAFAVLVDGSAKGMFGIDKAGDAVKEFTLLSTDMSKKSVAAYQTIGLDAHEMANKILAGGDSAQGATQKIIDGLLAIKDPATQANTAISLFGTPIEDMNVQDIPAFLQSLKGASGSMDGFGGAAKRSGDALRDNATTAVEEFKRKAMSNITAVGGAFARFAMDHSALFGPIAATLSGVALAILTVSAAQKVYATYTAIASAAQAIWNAEIWASTAALLANPMTWVVLGIIALVAVIVLIATKTQWFQQLWDTVWSAVQTAISVVWTWIQTNWPLLLAILTGPIGAAVLVIYRYWDQIKGAGEAVLNWFKALPGRIGGALSSMGSAMLSAGLHGFQMLKNGAAQKAVAFVSWVAKLPGQIARAIGSLNNLLYSKGTDIVRGLWNGIRSMGSWLRSTLIGWAKDLIPGPIAKALGIGSPSKLMAAEIGHWIPPGIAMGAEDNRGVLDKAMAGLVNPQAAVPARPLTGMAPIMGAAAGGGAVRVVVDTAGADGEMKRLMRKLVRVEGRGNVQVAFGQ